MQQKQLEDRFEQEKGKTRKSEETLLDRKETLKLRENEFESLSNEIQGQLILIE